MIKYGQIYTDGTSNYKILTVSNDIVFVSSPDLPDATGPYYTKTEFLNLGLTKVPQATDILDPTV